MFAMLFKTKNLRQETQHKLGPITKELDDGCPERRLKNDVNSTFYFYIFFAFFNILLFCFVVFLFIVFVFFVFVFLFLLLFF